MLFSIAGGASVKIPTRAAAPSQISHTVSQAAAAPIPDTVISPITVLEPGFSSAIFSGDDGFDAFLSQGGAVSDAQAAEFLAKHFSSDISLSASGFGCSTLAVKSPEGHALFGRNFDWQACDALVLTSKPVNGYASISIWILSVRAAAAWARRLKMTGFVCWSRCTPRWTE